MPGEYDVSGTSMKDLEQVWLMSRTEIASNLQVHQCVASFFHLLETGGSELNKLFAEMGERLSVSPHDVRERLRQAQKGGILRVSARLSIALSTELQQRFSDLSEGLCQRVIVGEVENKYLPTAQDRLNAVAEAAADYFINVVPQKRLARESGCDYSSGWIGVSGGNTMLNVVQRIIRDKKGQYEGLTVIPLAGEAEPEKFGISANSVVLRLAEACVPGKAETYSLMTTPIVADDGEQVERLRKTTEKSPSIKQVIDLAKHVKFAFTGIGETGSGEDAQDAQDALSRLAKHLDLGAMPEQVIGDILYRPIDKNGALGWRDLYDRLVGPNLDDLRHIAADPEHRRVFAVACGTKKVDPLIAVVRGKLVNGIITDELTALEILHQLQIEDAGKRAAGKKTPA